MSGSNFRSGMGLSVDAIYGHSNRGEDSKTD
jgi:hypothetical protein